MLHSLVFAQSTSLVSFKHKSDSRLFFCINIVLTFDSKKNKQKLNEPNVHWMCIKKMQHTNVFERIHADWVATLVGDRTLFHNIGEVTW